MIDLQQIATALRLSTRRSLIVIDEFGKRTESSGTYKERSCGISIDPDFLTNGAGLACGVFEHLLCLGSEQPKVLGATHFHGKSPCERCSHQYPAWG